MTRNSEGCGDLNVSSVSWAEERELAEDNGAMVSPARQLQPRIQQQQGRIGQRKWRGRSLLTQRKQSSVQSASPETDSQRKIDFQS